FFFFTAPTTTEFYTLSLHDALPILGLSMTTKLAPKKFAGQMMGIWFIGAALGNLIAGLFAGNFDEDNVAQMPDLFMSVVMTGIRSEEHTSELQSRENLVCRLLLEKK